MVMRPPQVVKVGTKKTAFVNFTEIAKMLHRQPKHLLSFLTAELGTPGAAIDGNDQLILKGRFQQKHIENVLRRYIKKKKKKKRAGEGMDINDDADENKENEASEAWMDSDRDYSYDELLQRVFGIMRDRNPDMVAGEKRKFVMRPPQVVKVGTKKTAFVNFTEIAKMLHRQPKHLLSFLTAE